MTRHLEPPRPGQQLNRTKGRVQDLERRLQKREGRRYLEAVPSIYLTRPIASGKQDLLSSTTSVPSPGQPGQTPIQFTRMVASPDLEAFTWSPSDPTKLWVRQAGLCLVTWAVSVDHNSTGGRYWEVGEWVPDGSSGECLTATGLQENMAEGGSDLHNSGAIIAPLTAGNFLMLRCWQTSGSTLQTGESPMPKLGVALLSEYVSTG